jgi:phage terminase large subunit-like protein
MASAPSDSSTGKSRRSGDPRKRAAPRPPVCGFTLDGVSCPKRGDHFCRQRAEHVAAFFRELLVHTKGRWARRAFDLEPWQADDIVRPVFGTVRWAADVEAYVRVYQIVWIEVARKNGKSELMAGIALYLLVADNEEGAEVYGCAKDKDQARKVFDVAKRMVELSPILSRRLKIMAQAKRIVDERTGSYYEVVAADAAGNLGHNPHGIVFDEVLTQPNGDLWEAMKTGMGTRDQPLMVAATTAGNDPESFAKAEHDEMVRISQDPTRSPRTFVYIRNVPKDADPWDETLWPLGNPALGTFLKIETLRQEATEARTSAVKENSFRQYRLNQWVSQVTRYIQLDEWDENAGNVALSLGDLAKRLKGKVCWAGLDLSSKLDLTAWALLFEDGTVLWRFWCPDSVVPVLDKHTDGRFGTWVRDGWITATDGDVIDYDAIYRAVEQDARDFDIRLAHYDKWSGEPVRQEIVKRTGMQMYESGATFERMTGPMKELTRMLTARELKHAGNPVARWMADALEAKTPRDDPDRIRPVKPDRQKSGRRIDGMVALLHAIESSTALVEEAAPPPAPFALIGD